MATARSGQVSEAPPERPRRPSVLHVLEAVEGGTARHLVDITRLVDGVQHEVVVPAERVGGVTDPEAAGAMRAAGARIHLVAMTRTPFSLRNARAIMAVRRLVSDLRPDIVHGHSTIGGVVARVAACRAPAATVYTPNALPPHPAVVRLERVLGRCTDRFVAVSQSEAEWVARNRLVPDDRLTVIPNGISLDPQESSTDLRLRLGVGTAPLVGTVSRLVRQKGPEDFVRGCALVARAVPTAHFALIGAGPRQRQLEREVRRAGIGARFHQIEFLAGASSSLGQLDVFVMTSRFEAGPYTPLEAMRAGTPVVLTDVTGNRDVVEQGVSGLLVPPGDPSAMAAAIADVLLDRELARTLAAAGQRRLRERFDVLGQARALGALYQELAR